MASVTYGKCIMANVIMAKVFMAKVFWQMKLSRSKLCFVLCISYLKFPKQNVCITL